MSTNKLVSEPGISVMEQLGFDAINLVKRYKLAWIRAMENRIPDQEVIAYVNGTYESMKTNYKLSGNTICNGIEDATGKMVLGCVFIERTGELMLLDTGSGVSKKDSTILEIILIVKLLNDGFNSHIPASVTMKDTLNPAHIKKLGELGVTMSISVDSHLSRQVLFTIKK